MSTYKMEKALRRELSILNERIDDRIIRGLSYAAESRRHRFILRRLYDLRAHAQSGSGWFFRSLNLFSI